MDVSVQLYTVRKDAQKDLAGTLARLKALGFTRVELARIDFNEENARIVKDSGMEVTSLQIKPKILEKKYPSVFSFCRTTGCGLVVASVLPLSGILGGRKALRNVASRLTALSILYGRENIRLAFHAHDFEFKRIGNETKLEILARETEPAVSFLLDTYWVKKSGEDPVRWAGFLGSRLAGLHLRDCAEGKNPPDCELGKGTVDFPALFASLPASVAYGAVEQDSPNPWDSLKISIEYLRSLNQNNVHI